MKKICIFCGSASGIEGKGYTEMAQNLGHLIAKNGWGLVYGGASVGVMGVIADSCLKYGGEVIGVIPESLQEIEVGHDHLTQLYVVDSMHARKQLMYDLSDAFIALPGGFGTLDELCEIMTWAQLKHHQKPCFIYNYNGFFNHLLEHFDFIVQEGFLSIEHRRIAGSVNSQNELEQKLSNL